MNRKLLFHACNGILRMVGLKVVRVGGGVQEPDPITRLLARGLSTVDYNSRENMDSFYSDTNILPSYFTEDRLEFYTEVCSRLGRLDIQPGSVLDVGCGSGHLLAGVKKLWPQATLNGVDFSSKSIELAARLHPEIAFRQMSIFDLGEMEQAFDLVLCTEVLEHLEAADEALAGLYARCRPGGAVVITVPDGRADTFHGHFNFWTPESFCREFRQFGPTVEKSGNYLFIAIRRGSDIESAISARAKSLPGLVALEHLRI